MAAAAAGHGYEVGEKLGDGSFGVVHKGFLLEE